MKLIAEKYFVTATGDLAERRKCQPASIVDRPLTREAAHADDADRAIEPISETMLTVPVSAASARRSLAVRRRR
ncbi:MAG: hypothetical protein IT334_03885 [Thermomicrobiales bacterium]|nr:hypothetical protein [Thermomicrobiales bacterium]